MSCNPSSHILTLAFDIGVHVSILFLILSIFFILIVSKLSKKAINKEITKSIDKYLETPLKEQVKSTGLHANMSNTDVMTVGKLYAREDLTVKTNNDWVFNTIIFVNIVLIIILLLSIILIRYNCNICVPIKNILISNIIIFSLVGIVEYLFFTHIALKFVPVKPSVMTLSFIENLKEQLN